jgi:hypothetical protein
LGQTESVAVFYNSNALQFTGPNIVYDRYPLGFVQVRQPQPANAHTFAHILDYQPAWQAALPVALGRTTNFMINGVVQAIPEWRLGAEWQYYTTPPPRPVPSPLPPAMPPNRIYFPFIGCRGPFYTRFLDIAAGRTINLFSIHTSPASAVWAIQNMQNVVEMAGVAAGSVNVILGDFNVDTFAAGGLANYWMAPPGIYDMAFDPRVAHAGAVVPARRRYCMTHFLMTSDATPFNNTGGVTDPQHNRYPRYGYMGESFPAISDDGAIDNIFVAYGAGAGGPVANQTIINTVVGKPYNVFPAPVGVTGELTGGPPFAASLNNPIPLAVAPGGVNPPVDNIGFRNWLNFGVIRSTSDHLPLMIDV